MEFYEFQGEGVSEASEISSYEKWSKDGQVAALSDKLPQEGGQKEELDLELQPIPPTLDDTGERFQLPMEDWDNILAGSESSSSQEQSFRRFFLGEVDDLKQVSDRSAQLETSTTGFGVIDPRFRVFESGNTLNSSSSLPATMAFTNNPRVLSNPHPSSLPNCFNNCDSLNPILSNNLPLLLSSPPGVFYQQQLEPGIQISQVLSPQNQLIPQEVQQLQNNSPFFVPLPYTHHEHQQQQQHHLLPGHPSPPKNHDPSDQISTIPFAGTVSRDLFLGRQQQQVGTSYFQQPETKSKLADLGAHQASHHGDVIAQLVNAAQLIEKGNSVHARTLLTRLNHELSPTGKPLRRAAFYFKKALELLLSNHNCVTLLPTPSDIVLKMEAYKVFLDVSPILHFANFTCNQALLESLHGFNRIHVIDFNIELGGQWASFMQELAMKPSGAPSLKITALVSPFNHRLELTVAKKILSYFAQQLNIPFEFNLMNLDSFEPTVPNVSDKEAIAVKFPVGSSQPSAPSLLRLIKKLNPKIVVSIDRGCDRSDLSFSKNILHALQSYSVLLDSLEAINPDALQEIEKFLIKPSINSIVLGRQQATEKMMPWRNMFMSAGFAPLPFSDMIENQMYCLVNRLHVRGFHVEKHHNSLFLYWKQGELVSASAWRC